ncbi:hypothetical protein EDD18DRAFT_1358492 [Armillaria luteobubalina]|uniref:Uncharacterized protein n=1 Tax=Armillaria luteobubalina TaxID=153913 RepID=A0AA39PY04_9AGAR|nr:hypothetical protein EDD18DRAFT_1358492 [Armillaria luteobubalina]
MDQFYNALEASRTIDGLTAERVAKDKYHLVGEQDAKLLHGVSVEYEADAQVWRLAKGEDELVFTITGAIASMDLPPITRETHSMREKLRFLSQSVTLTGCGGVEFEQIVANLKDIHARGEREFRQGQLLDWMPTQVHGSNAIELSNRYFQRKTSSSTQSNGIQIGRNVDPNGILRKLAGDKLEHTEDNEVKYYQGVAEGEKKRYVETKPQVFRVSDIVEARCSIVFVTCKGGDAKMKLILRALALVNCEHTTDADRERKRGDDSRDVPNTSNRMKRKVGFEYSDSEEDKEDRVKRQQQAETDENGEMITDT